MWYGPLIVIVSISFIATFILVPPDSLCTEEDFLVVKGRESEVQNYKTWFDATSQLGILKPQLQEGMTTI